MVTLHSISGCLNSVVSDSNCQGNRILTLSYNWYHKGR